MSVDWTLQKNMCTGTMAVYTVEQLLNLKHDYDPRSVPAEMQNFKLYLTRCPQLVEQLQVTIQEGDIVRISDQEIDADLVILRKLKGILNKITEKTYDIMFQELKRFNKVRNPTALQSIIDTLVENIKLCKDYAKLYARLVRDVTQSELWEFPGKNFNTVVLDSCMREVQEALGDRKFLHSQLAPIQHKDARFETELKYKAGVKSLLGFVAHMFLLSIVGPKTMTNILFTMLPAEGCEVDAYNVEFLSMLYPLVAEKAKALAPERMPVLEASVKTLLARVSDRRLQFMIQDLISLMNKN